MLSSAAVRSSAVPNVVTVLRNDSGPAGESITRVTATPLSSTLRSNPRDSPATRRTAHATVRAAGRHLASQPTENMRPPLGKVEDPRGEPFGMQAESQRVGHLEQVRRNALEQRRDPGIGHHHVPAAVDDQARKGLVRREEPIHTRPEDAPSRGRPTGARRTRERSRQRRAAGSARASARPTSPRAAAPSNGSALTCPVSTKLR